MRFPDNTDSHSKSSAEDFYSALRRVGNRMRRQLREQLYATVCGGISLKNSGDPAARIRADPAQARYFVWQLFPRHPA
jgi:hypothetical protein